MLNCQLLVHQDEGVEPAGSELAALPRVSGSGIDVSLPQVLPCDLRVLPRLPAGGPGSAPKGLADWHPVKRAGASQI